MAPKRPTGSSSLKPSQTPRLSNNTSSLRRTATNYRRLLDHTNTYSSSSDHQSRPTQSSPGRLGYELSNITISSDTPVSGPYSQRSHSRLSIDHQDMASPQGVKRNADAMFIDTDNLDEQMGEGGSLRPFTALPTPTTPTTPGKRFKDSDAEGTDIVAKLNIRDDGTVAPYDAFRIEGRPRLAYYSKSRPKAEELVAEVAALFLKAAHEQADNGYHHVEIFNICDTDLTKFLKVQDLYPKFGPVALLGPAGAGKSSLINALLNESGIAIESDESQRGTNLVHELIAAHPRQKSRFQVSVPFHDEPQIRAMVLRHCKHIFEWLKKNDDDFDEGEGDDMQDACNAAIEFFIILLCDLPDFKTKQAAEEYFDARLNDPIGDVVEHLTGLVEDFKDTRTLDEGIEYHDAEDEEGLADIFRQVSRVPRNKNPTPHPWPIVTKIQIRFDNELLKAGLVVGDTPGMTDGNKDVVNATTRYLDGASVVILVEEKKRLTANKTLDINLRECLWRGKHGDNIQLVLTAIDKTEGKISHHKRADLLPEDRQELEDAERAVSRLQAASATMAQQKNALMASGSMSDELRRLDRELNEMPIRIKHAQATVKQVLVKISIRDTESDVQAKLRDFGREKKAPNLAVHGVSNKDYQVHRAGYHAAEPPSLDVRGTGIPGLRYMLYQKAAHGKSSTLSRICQVQLPSIFKGIIGILTKSRLERKQEVAEVIEQVLAENATISTGVVAELNTIFVRRVLDVIDNNQNAWEQRGDKTFKQLTKLARGNTFHAFVRKYGVWKTKDEGEYSWNDRIQNVMGEKLAAGFDSFEDDLVGIETNNAANVKELFDKLKKALNECDAFQGGEGARAFYERIHAEHTAIANIFKDLFGDLRNDVKTIRHRCLLDQGSEAPSTYVAQAMRPTYEYCKTVLKSDAAEFKKNFSGTKKSRIADILRAKITGAGTGLTEDDDDVNKEGSVFSDVSQNVSEDFERIMARWETTSYAPKLANATKHVLSDFDRRFTVPEEVKEERDEDAIEALKNAAYQALDIIEGPMKEHLNKCDGYEQGLID